MPQSINYHIQVVPYPDALRPTEFRPANYNLRSYNDFPGLPRPKPPIYPVNRPSPIVSSSSSNTKTDLNARQVTAPFYSTYDSSSESSDDDTYSDWILY